MASRCRNLLFAFVGVGAPEAECGADVDEIEADLADTEDDDVHIDVGDAEADTNACEQLVACLDALELASTDCWDEVWTPCGLDCDARLAELSDAHPDVPECAAADPKSTDSGSGANSPRRKPH